MTELEQAAVDYVTARERLASIRYQVGDRRARVDEGLAWSRLKQAAANHEGTAWDSRRR